MQRPAKYIGSLFLLLMTLFFISCEKRIGFDEEEQVVVDPPVTGGEDAKNIKDSIYYYYKLFSLWETSIPVYDPISVFTDPIASSSEVLRKLKAMTPAFGPYSNYGGTYDRFSFLTTLNGFDANSSTLFMDSNDGNGLSFSMGAINDSVAYPVVFMVEGGSPGSKAGVRRGDVLLAVDDADMKVAVTCDTDGCKAVDENRFTQVSNAALRINSANEVRIKVQKDDDVIKSYTLMRKTYEIDPLMADTVFKFANKNVGYFAYSSFEEIEGNNLNQRNINQLFNEFEQEDIKDLIVDLRYNGGGYVDAAIYIADKIINTAGKNKKMLKYEVNDYLERGKSQAYSTFNDVYFSKTSNLELQTVCFIVSKSTASAAEMLINVLKPYMNVKLIAEERYTYGKPVGFFPQEISGKVNLWVTSFKLLNANNQADYWTGMLGDVTGVTDYIFLDFGVKEEKMIAAALDLTGAINPQNRARSILSRTNRGLSKIGDINTVTQKGALKSK